MDLVIGVGNTLRRDDGIGPSVVSALPLLSGVGTITVHQLTPELTGRLSRANRVLFVDAHCREDEPVRLERIEEENTPLGHAFSPAGLLGLTAVECGSAPAGWLLTVPGFDFEFGEQLSEPAAALIPTATQAVIAWIEEGRTAGENGVKD